MVKHAALYIRVSTDAQFEEGYSVDAQKEMLAAFCKSKNIKKYQFYIDGGFTGSNINRPEMERLIENAKNEKISQVIVYKLDRLSRSQKDTLYLIEDVFLPHNVDFISINESFDTSTPFGRAMIGILSVFAQLERENIRLRTRMGMKERVKQGLWMGGGRVPFGYDYDKNKGILVPNKDAETVRKVYELYLNGYSCQSIADMLNLKYDKLASQILKRKSNIGIIEYNGEEFKGKHEPLVSEETYNKAMEMMLNRSTRCINNSENLLVGLVYCGKCGAKMAYKQWGRMGKKFLCYSQQKNKKYLIKDPDCDQERVWTDEVEKIVIDDIFDFAINFTKETENSDTPKIDSAIDILEDEYFKITKKIKNLYNLYAESENELLLETINENKNKLKLVTKQIENERKLNTQTLMRDELKNTLSNLSEIWSYMTFKERQNIIRALIKKITITGNTVKIDYKL